MKKKTTVILLVACLFTTAHRLNAQSWNLTGNTNLTATSKLGGTSATAAQNFPLSLYTYNAERIHINANVSGKVGFVGLGTAAPATRLHVNGVITATGGTSTNWNLAYTRVPAGTSSRVPRWNGTSYVAGKFYDNGTVTGVGAVNADFALNVVGLSTGGINVTEGGIKSKNTTGDGLTCEGDFYGVYSIGNNSGYGVVGTSTGGIGVYGSGTFGTYGSGTTYGAYGTGSTYGVYGTSSSNYGVYGTSGYLGVYGSGNDYGIYGISTNGDGATGTSTNHAGVNAYSSNWHGAHIESFNNNGLWSKTFSATAGVYAGVFEGSVYTYGVYSASDRQLKKNIEDVDNAMSLINRLKPKSYEFRDDGDFAAMHLPKGNHYGLIAQEVEEVIPEIVAAAPDGLGAPPSNPELKKPGEEQTPVERQISNTPPSKAINYTELIPIIIKAMQEQQQEISTLKAENAQMKQDLQSCCLNHSTASTDAKLKNEVTDKPWLEQNAPNPFSEQTIIRYYIPAGNTAVLKVVSLGGEQVMAKEINRAGYGEIQLSASTLAAGTYTYTLIVQGKAVESKIMVLTK